MNRPHIPQGLFMRRSIALAAAAVVCCAASLTGATAASAAPPPTAQISGTGSSWAANAIYIWISQVQSEGVQVVFTDSGSAQGRIDFRNYTNDFAVSDIGFQGVDPKTGLQDTNCTTVGEPSTCRPYAYLPIVGGGTSFPYQIRVGGQLVTNLRLSGLTLAKIFTGHITNWDNPAITADNNGHALPSLQIIVVDHSEGSGSTAQFSDYLNTLYPSLWQPFSGIKGLTEYWPADKPGQVAENGSDSVLNFVTSAAANGAIGYDEYSYARQRSCPTGTTTCTFGWPVALLENEAGYFLAPTEYNTAVALTQAQINTDKSSPNYLLQTLNKVYVDPDPRAYAMSSYSYMIMPTSPTDQRMTTAKRQALADFIDYAICNGQAPVGPIGYTALPVNLVEASFAQMNKLKTADPAVQLGNENVLKCHNPTFVAGHPNENLLALIAPEPPACDKSGQGPCPGETGVTVNANPVNGKAPKPGPSSSPSPGASGSPSPGSSSSTGPSPGSSAGSSPGSTTTSNSGSGTGTSTSTGGSSPGSTSTSGNGVTAIGNPTNIAESDSSNIGMLLAVLAAFEFLLLLAIPPLIARRKQQQQGERR
jgi:phosphate transport system substrate-binding protein